MKLFEQFVEWLLTWCRAFHTAALFRHLAQGMLALQVYHNILAKIIVSWKLFVTSKVSQSDDANNLHELLDIVGVQRRKAVDQLFIDTCNDNLASCVNGKGAPLFQCMDAAVKDKVQPEEYCLTKATAVELVEDVAQAVGYFLWKNLDSIRGFQPEATDRADKVLCPVALLMPNSVDYFPLAYGISRSSVWLNILESCNMLGNASGDKNNAPYYHACASLINTNLPSNQMLRAALEASSATVIIVDETMVPLLFADEEGHHSASKSGIMRNPAKIARLSLPPCVQTILLWKSAPVESPRGREPIMQLYSNLQPWAPKNEQSGAERPISKSDTTLGCDLFNDVISRARSVLPNSAFPVIQFAIHGVTEPHAISPASSASSSTVSTPRRKKRDGTGRGCIIGSPVTYQAIKRCVQVFRRFKLIDPMLMIFTSGTTGLPKAAKFSHLRYHGGLMLCKATVHPQRILRQHGQGDGMLTVYDCLPMYHSAGGVFCPCHLINLLQQQTKRNRSWFATEGDTSNTARLVLRKKFSASGFGQDLQAMNVTVVQYIGELLRYAVDAPKKDRSARNWVVPYAFGNGLRPDVWMPAKERFNIERIAEFYASTEGNVGFCNYYNEPGAVGHIPIFPWPFYSFSPHLFRTFPMVFCRYDADTEEPRRDPHSNRCSRGGIDDPCEVLGIVATGFDPLGLRRFDGYLNDKKSTKKKLQHNVLRDGDMYFRTGDLLKFDKRGFVYFIDRVGDTFRWKGENVSTLEVSNALNSIKSIPMGNAGDKPIHITVADAVVFGVHVPNHEGKAGMAKVTIKINCELPLSSDVERKFAIDFMKNCMYSQLWAKNKLPSSLPTYAVPVFFRVEVYSLASKDEDSQSAAGGEAEEQMTATFKHRKLFHQRMGFQQDDLNSMLFQLTPVHEKAEGGWVYEPITESARSLLEQGRLPPGSRW